MSGNIRPADAYSELPFYMVKDFETIVELPKVTHGLLDRGWSAGDVRKVFRRELAARV